MHYQLLTKCIAFAAERNLEFHAKISTAISKLEHFSEQIDHNGG